MRGNQTGLRIWYMTNFQAYYNLIIDNNFQTNGVTQNTSGVDFRSALGVFHNNVLNGNCASNSKLGSRHVYPEGVSNISIKNNIVMNDGSSKDMDFDHIGESVIDSDYNLVYNENRAVNIQVGNIDYSWSDYKSITGRDVHSINNDPMFADSGGGNYTVRAGSPAINAGVDVGLAADFGGNIIFGLPSIGAFQYN